MISIIGLGYVGLPLATRFAEVKYRTLGLDIDMERIASLNKGISHLPSAHSSTLQQLLKEEKIRFSTDFAEISSCDASIICVPTPLNKNREPDLGPVRRATASIAPHIKKGSLIVLESTSYPGTTEEVVVPLLEQGSGLGAGVDFHVAYSPEREDPGNPDSAVSKVPKIVGGLTPVCLEKAVKLYEEVVGKVVPVSNCRTAEATKLTENIFRSVNIALVNELKVVYAAMGIDVWEVIAAASTKPFGFMPFYPGPGLGGHCIPIDPFYLTWKAREFHQNCKFVELAGEINTAMPEYVAARVSEALNEDKKSIKGSHVLVIGIAYKANVGDDRESPAYRILDLLVQRGAQVAYHDPHVPELTDPHYQETIGKLSSIPWTAENLRRFDCTVIVTAHANIAFGDLPKYCRCIVDTRNVMETIAKEGSRIWKA